MKDPEYEAGRQDGYRWMTEEVLKNYNATEARKILNQKRKELTGNGAFRNRRDEGFFDGARGALAGQ